MKIAYVVGNDNPTDPDPDLDIPFATEAAARLDIDLVFTNWNDKSIAWESFDAAVIRSTWDYVPVRDEFLQFAKTVETKTKLFNSYDVMRWNTDKKYLSVLEAKGVPIIPTKFAGSIDEALPALTKGGHGDAAGQLEITNEVREIVKTISNTVSEWNDLLFARVDVVRMEEKLVLMELELTEPWLFMQFRPAAGVDLFKALKQRIA